MASSWLLLVIAMVTAYPITSNDCAPGDSRVKLLAIGLVYSLYWQGRVLLQAGGGAGQYILVLLVSRYLNTIEYEHDNILIL